MCYTFSCNFPIRYVSSCNESKILSLKYLHLQLLIQTSQFYVGSWHKLLKSKHCWFLNITFFLDKNLEMEMQQIFASPWFPSLWEISMLKFQVQRSYLQKVFFEFSLNVCKHVVSLLTLKCLFHFEVICRPYILE